MSIKSEKAFFSTCNRFADYCASLDTGMFFWSFTLRKEMHDWQVPYVFGRLMVMVKDRYRYDDVLFGGVRVIERQKKSKRPHWHALINKRVPIDWLETVGRPLGVGWMWVEKARTRKGAIDYLGKYIGKDIQNSFVGTRMPVWGTVGHAPFRTTKADIVISNEKTRFMSRIRREVFGDAAMPNWLARDVHQSHHVGYRERDDFIIWHAKQHDLRTGAAWEPLNWPEWKMQQETEGLGVSDWDGRIPF